MAANPILAQMGQAQVPQLNQLKNLITTVKNAGNPALMLQSMFQNNPMYQQAMGLIQQNNGDAKAAFCTLAQHNGIDPNEILSLLR